MAITTLRPEREPDLLDRPARLLATALGAGYSPIVPGTAGSLVGVVTFWALSGLPPLVQVALTLALFLIGIPASSRTAARGADPGIVVDEVWGSGPPSSSCPGPWTAPGLRALPGHGRHQALAGPHLESLPGLASWPTISWPASTRTSCCGWPGSWSPSPDARRASRHRQRAPDPAAPGHEHALHDGASGRPGGGGGGEGHRGRRRLLESAFGRPSGVRPGHRHGGLDPTEDDLTRGRRPPPSVAALARGLVYLEALKGALAIYARWRDQRSRPTSSRAPSSEPGDAPGQWVERTASPGAAPRAAVE
jgi:hypothetical protein